MSDVGQHCCVMTCLLDVICKETSLLANKTYHSNVDLHQTLTCISRAEITAVVAEVANLLFHSPGV